MTPTPTRCIRVTEVADRLGLSPRHVYDLIYRHQLPAVRAGRAWTIPETALEQFIADGGTTR